MSMKKKNTIGHEVAFLSSEEEIRLEVACNYQEFEELNIDGEKVDTTTLFVYVF